MAYSGGYADGYASGGLDGSSALTTAASGSLTAGLSLTGSSALVSTVAAAAGSLNVSLGASSAFTTTVSGDVSQRFTVFVQGTSSLSTGVSGSGFTIVAGAAGASALRFATGYVDLTQHFTFAVEGRTQVVMGAAGTVGVNWALEGRSLVRFPVTGTVVPDPTFTFIPPLSYDMNSVLPSTHGVQRQLFRYYAGNPRGLSVVKVAGHFTTVDNPYAATLVGTDGVDFFLGGHQYTVTKAVAAALLVDGYVAV